MDYDSLSPVQGRGASAIVATSAPVYIPDQDYDVPGEDKGFCDVPDENVEPTVLPATLERAVQAAALEHAVQAAALEPAIQIAALQSAVQFAALEPSVQIEALEPAVLSAALQGAVERAALEPAAQFTALEPEARLTAIKRAILAAALKPDVQAAAYKRMVTFADLKRAGEAARRYGGGKQKDKIGGGGGVSGGGGGAGGNGGGGGGGGAPQIPPLQLPQGPPRHWDYGAMIKRVHAGVMIELSTIPLYLYAMYSIKPTNQAVALQVRATLRSVVEQEMLHLSLAGNLLSALGGSVELYDPRVVPQYPGRMLYGKIPMILEALKTESLGRFMEIESAADGGVLSPMTERDVLASQYTSIGELYEDLITGVRGLPDENFTKNPGAQFCGNRFFGDHLFAINNQSTALRALRTIIEQGEGNLRVDDSHYDVFSKLYSRPQVWDVHQVPDNPKTVDYWNIYRNNYVYRLSLAFDAAYCYLLQTIQRVWHPLEKALHPVLFRNIHGIMSNLLTPLAEILVQQKLGGENVAAPCFNYYALTTAADGSLVPSPRPLRPKYLYRELRLRVREAICAVPEDALEQQRVRLKTIEHYVGENLRPVW